MTASNAVAPMAANAVKPQRRLQNRIAQRRFRQRAKARKQCFRQPTQETTGRLTAATTSQDQNKCCRGHGYDDFSLQDSHCSESTSFGGDIAVPDDPSEMQLFSPTIAPDNMTLSQDTGYPWTTDIMNDRSPVCHQELRSTQTDSNQQDTKENALTTIQKPSTIIQSERKQVVEVWEEIYELAAFMGISSAESDFTQLLEMTKDRFLVLFPGSDDLQQGMRV